MKARIRRGTVRCHFSIALGMLLCRSGLSLAHGGEVIYFLVGPIPPIPVAPPFDGAYVLPIPKSRPDDVRHARELIALGRMTDRTIVVAAIATGADGVNHNLLHPDLPAWHWHVPKFGAFADATTGMGSGHPSLIEANPERWVQTGMALSYYTVVRELGEEPVFVRANPKEIGMQLNWWSPGTNLVFTVESTGSLAVPDWKPAPGTQWPITNRTWTASTEVAGSYFRVIRANAPPVGGN
jgi:hypothetical protein